MLKILFLIAGLAPGLASLPLALPGTLGMPGPDARGGCGSLMLAQTRCCTLASGARCCGRSTGGSGISGCRCR